VKEEDAMTSKTVRNLVFGGSYNSDPNLRFSTFAGTRRLNVNDGAGTLLPADLKPGCTIVFKKWTGSAYEDRPCTVLGGAWGEFLIDQSVDISNTFVGWDGSGAHSDYVLLSDPGTGKGRGTNGVLVPDATHYLYLSTIDDAGNPDYYVYVDTLDPRRGVHPYTKDKAIGSFTTPPRSLDKGRMIADLATRVRDLEGVVRAGRSAGSSVQDDRLAKLVARVVTFETWANGPGHFGTPPAVGSGTVYVEDDFIQAGDQA